LEVTAARSGVLIVSAELRVLAWSDGLEAATGLRYDEAIGRHCWQALRVLDSDGQPVCGPHCPLARRALATGASAKIEVQLAGSSASRASLSITRVQVPRRQLLVHTLELYGPDPSTDASQLSPRQMEILRLLADGRSTDQIAEGLGISRLTARNHINALLRRLDSRSRVEALARARQAGLLP
jgi:DNA-binding CsgD family transcriptional regulator